MAAPDVMREDTARCLGSRDATQPFEEGWNLVGTQVDSFFIQLP